MIYAVAALVLLGLLFGPQLWARYVFFRYGRERDDIPGTGGELARHLVGRFGMDVGVETVEGGDHYDPAKRVIRLSPTVHDRRSITAIAVAAHEVGHALQHHRGERPLELRGRLVQLAGTAERIGAGAMIAVPLITAVTRMPASGLLMLLVGLASLGVTTLVHLVTLPVEWDASFGKALPLLKAGGYVSARQEPAVRRVLRAAALTYVAASLASLLNMWRWGRALRGR